MKTYTVNEIFHSLQGEGFFTGTPAVFLRFSGCNRRCDFCDTDHNHGVAMTADEICREVSSYPSRHLVLTGGEPTLQLDDALVERLHETGFYIQIETNGSLAVPAGVDWVTCSPKTAPFGIDRINELKIVYQGQDVESILAEFRPKLCQHRPAAPVLFLQPCSGRNIPETVDYILSHPHWRLSLQTHKLINIL